MQKVLILVLIGFAIGISKCQAQSQTMQTLSNAYPEAHTLVIYHSNLTMLNTADNPQFAKLVAAIDKIKVLRMPSSAIPLNTSIFNQLKKEGFELLMELSYEGAKVIVYILGNNEDMKGYFIWVNNHQNVTVIDVIGSPSPTQIKQIIDTVNKF